MVSEVRSVTSVKIPVDGRVLEGDLEVPIGAEGVVVFAHGSGSGRQSPRNRAVAAALRERGLATLLMDLLTREEEVVDARTSHMRFDIGLLAGRVEHAMEWVAGQEATGAMRIGLFGASTGAGAALEAAARRPLLVSAVVSRGGRPDLAGDALARVKCPTLLIVGEKDEEVVGLNRAAMSRMKGTEVAMVIVPGATHLFEEAGTLEQVSKLAGEWFVEKMGRDGVPRGA